MCVFRTELLKSGIKFGFNDSASRKDLEKLDAFLTQRQEEGWELVTYSYMVNILGIRSAFAITFKKNN